MSTIQGGYTWAGSEELWFRTAELALEHGHEVTALVHRPIEQSTQMHQLQHLGGEILTRESRYHRRLFALLEKFRSSLRVAVRRNPELIIASAGSILDIYYWESLLDLLDSNQIPFVIIVQFNAETLSFSTESRLRLASVFKKARDVIFVSEDNKQLALRQLATNLPNARVIFNPIRLVLEKPLPMPEVAEVARFACVARFETLWKGQDVLLECLSKGQWKERAWSLRFYGDGPDKQHIENLVRMFGLEEKVSFPGYERDVAKIWNDNHVMLLASRGEGMSLAVLEAMMCGRPVLTTDVGGTSELIEHNVNGFFAETATVRSLGAALETMWKARVRWNEIGNLAHFKARLLSNDDAAEKVLEVLVCSSANG